mmetsp:Transcript_137201/g.382695  ORF Transcript_137201/g.382695 Transcript_137201/m.382695 type:complete len:892 (-) Transcript_137201:135-2810(-)
MNALREALQAPSTPRQHGPNRRNSYSGCGARYASLITTRRVSVTPLDNELEPTEEDAFRWAKTAPEDDVLAFLYKLSQARPGLVEQVVGSCTASPKRSTSLTPLSSMTWKRLGRESSYTTDSTQMTQAVILQQLTPDGSIPPILQFSAFMYYTLEGDGEDTIKLDVIRIGDNSQRSEVDWETWEGSAKEGQRFHPGQGRLIFEPGETMKQIEVVVIGNDCWDMTEVEFSVVLRQDSVANAVLGKYLWACRVKIIDDDAFPSNRFLHQIRSCDLDAVPVYGLLWEYIKLNLTNPIVYRGSIKTCLAVQSENLLLVAKLVVNVYLIDRVLDTSSDESQLLLVHERHASLFFAIMALMIPFAACHFLSYAKLGWKVAGTSRATLQSALLCRFLNYDPVARTQVSGSDVIVAMVKDVHELVDVGFSKVFHLVQVLGTLCVILAFQLIMPLAHGMPVSPLGVGAAVGLPLITLGFMYLRRKVTTRMLSKEKVEEARVLRNVEQAIHTYRIIADFHREGDALSRFEKRVCEFNSTRTAALKIMENNRYFVLWVTTIVVGAYIMIGGQRVLNEEISVGLFTANISAISAIGDCVSQVSTILMELQMVEPALQRLTRFLNMRTDLPDRLVLSQHRGNMTRSLSNKFRAGQNDAEVVDLLPICIKGCHFVSHDGEEPRRSLNLEFKQGQVTTIIGPAGEGKATTLRVVAGVDLPQLSTKDSVYMLPSHLRVLFVPLGTLFYDGSLLENLRYGVGAGDPDGSLERVLTICQKLNFPKHLLDMLKSEQPTADWARTISHSQRHLVGLARAFVANPEMLVLDKPTEGLSDLDADTVLGLIGEFVRDRGLEQDPALYGLRRPRTCIYSSTKLHSISVAQVVLLLTREEGIRMIEKEEITEEMLR